MEVCVREGENTGGRERYKEEFSCFRNRNDRVSLLILVVETREPRITSVMTEDEYSSSSHTKRLVSVERGILSKVTVDNFIRLITERW